MPKSTSAEGPFSRVSRGRAMRRLSFILGELEDLHNSHHDFSEREKALYAAAMDALHGMEASLAKAPRN